MPQEVDTDFEQPEYGWGKPYLLLDPMSGLMEALGEPAEYPDISRFKSSAQLMIEQGSPLNRYDLPPDLAYKSDLVNVLRRQMFTHSQSATGAGLSSAGTALPVTGGTATTVADTTGGYTNYASAVTNGSSASVDGTTVTTTQRQFGATCLLVVKTGPNATDIDANQRTWFGLSSAVLNASDNPAGAHIAAFRYSPASDATAFWRTVTKDGVNITATATTVAVAANTRYLFKIVFGANDVKFYINNVLTNTHTANLPGNATTIGFYESITIAAAAGSGTARNIRIAKWHMDEL